MPPFPVQFLQRLRNAGLGVYSESPSKEVDGVGPRVTAVDGDHKLILYGAKDKWIVEASYSTDEKCPGDFQLVFNTPDEAVANAIAYFKKDERWQSANDFIKRSQNKA
ncbi:MAG TPA: hypothetical protein EYN91_21365 [Candidatus Melainabacteria bacterium]|jgi:hypothetical protein|nr:hypothetical protein [Candidatus Melainabacteria bacterium]HIN66430.1 hypothetical protein [Candidatus Obscuribacterales bacterium]